MRVVSTRSAVTDRGAGSFHWRRSVAFAWLILASIFVSILLPLTHLAQEVQPTAQNSGVPTKFIQQIVFADMIIVTNVRPDVVPPPCKENYIRILNAPEVRRVVEALSKLKDLQLAPDLCGDPVLELHFYRGTNLMTTAGMTCGLIWCKEGRFEDHSGIEEELYQPFEEFLNKAHQQFNEDLGRKLGAYEKWLNANNIEESTDRFSQDFKREVQSFEKWVQTNKLVTETNSSFESYLRMRIAPR